MLSTRDLSTLLAPGDLKRICQSIAMLDAILMPDWQYRYYSFNAYWNTYDTMASMRNGSGDSYFIQFARYGTAIKGFAHESAMAEWLVRMDTTWLGILDQVPSAFEEFLEQPAFCMEDTTFCIWWLNSDPGWRVGDIIFPQASDPDGSEDLLCLLDGDPIKYCNWAEEYYEAPVPLHLIQRIYNHEPLINDIVTALNPQVSLDDLSEDVNEIGYP